MRSPLALVSDCVFDVECIVDGDVPSTHHLVEEGDNERVESDDLWPAKQPARPAEGQVQPAEHRA
jgi:hypothetical protein